MYPCGRTYPKRLNRRQALERVAHGFGSLAFANLLRSDPQGSASFHEGACTSTLPKPSHYPPRAKQVIMLYMDGGPAQMDTLIPNPD